MPTNPPALPPDDDHQPNPPESSRPEPDEELIAYLDGELSPEAEDALEGRLAQDPTLRLRLETLKRTYDLLDFLPKQEPSPDFTTRTLTKAQPVFRGISSNPERPSGLTGSATTTSNLAAAPVPKRRSHAGWWGVAVMLSLILGGGLRWLSSPPAAGLSDQGDLKQDVRVALFLPWYAGVDDLNFLKSLDDPELFAPDELALPRSIRATGDTEFSVTDADQLIELFQTLPPWRKQQLRKLDQEWHELPPTEFERYKAVLERYALWLWRLSDPERDAILAAGAAEERHEIVRQLRQKQWRESLPEIVRNKISAAATAEERLEFIQQYKARAWDRQQEWQLARRQWDTLRTTEGQMPWPFREPALNQGLQTYIKQVFRVDLEAKFDGKFELPAGARLSRAEFGELRESRRAAQLEQKWFQLGLTIYRLSERHPYLPEPAQGTLIVSLASLSSEVQKELRSRAPLAYRTLDRAPSRGKWPEFALDLQEVVRRAPFLQGSTPEFGPARLADFSPTLRASIEQNVLPKLTPKEREQLAKLEGKWPEYPRLLISFSRLPQIDCSLPDVTLPGAPSLWKKYYDFDPKQFPPSASTSAFGVKSNMPPTSGVNGPTAP